MILLYAVMSPARKCMKMNKEVPIRRLEKLEGRTLFSVEPKVRKIGTRLEITKPSLLKPTPAPRIEVESHRKACAICCV